MFVGTENEKWCALMKGIGELLAEKEMELYLKQSEIDTLKSKLEEYEKKAGVKA